MVELSRLSARAPVPVECRLSGCALGVERAADRQQVSAGARASPSWIGGRRRPTRCELYSARRSGVPGSCEWNRTCDLASLGIKTSGAMAACQFMKSTPEFVRHIDRSAELLRTKRVGCA